MSDSDKTRPEVPTSSGASKYFDIVEAKNAYVNGLNVIEVLKKQNNATENNSKIIELAYDLQAGTYSEYSERNAEFMALRSREVGEIISHHLVKGDRLLDVGTGEMTTLSHLTSSLSHKPSHIYAFDLSWSRIYKGLNYAAKHMGPNFDIFTPFVADMLEIPLRNKSVNVTISDHALEPNGARLSVILAELMRITKNKLILCEPSYELNTAEGKARMDRLGYIKGMEDTARSLGGKILEKIAIKNVYNSLNPTVCHVIDVSGAAGGQSPKDADDIFSVPGSDYPLSKVDDFFYNATTGLCFPILKSIPILKSNQAILATALADV